MKKSLLSVFLLFSAFAINAVTIGMQPSDLGYSTAVSAAITRSYDGTGKVKRLNLGDNISQSFVYNINGWLTSSTATAWMSGQVYPSDASAYPAPAGISLPGTTTIEECIHYADEVSGASPRYDGKIAARSCGTSLTAYGYDSHGRLASSQTVQQQHLLSPPDYSTAYSYDRNANITSLSRQGIVDRTILGNNVFGLHSRYTMKYAVNRLASMEIEREGEDYEGRTGVGATGKISDFWYDANGNLGRDLSRGILSTNYNRLDLPTDVYFINGHRQTIEYDGFGQKRRVSYSQTSDPILGTMMGVPEDSAYTLQGRRDYIGPHVFVGDSLEYSAFPGGYFTPEGVFYYITDWQGNNIAVFSDKGGLVQQTTYYPYGEPTIEPSGQRYLFGGKEREHAGGRNSYDFVARSLGPSANWDSPDKLATETPQISPFSYCGGDPINRVDPTGMRPIYSTTGDFLGIDDNGLTGDPWIMDKQFYTPAMSHKDAESLSVDKSSLSPYIQEKISTHWSHLSERPDYDGYVTISEGIKWAKEHPNALKNPTPNNTLYIDTSKLDFGSLSTSDFKEVGEKTPQNLFTNDISRTLKSAFFSSERNVVYALGRVDMILLDRNKREVKIVNNEATDYDWNTGGGKLRSFFINLERIRTGLNDTHGFKTFYYGIGKLHK